MFSSRHLKVLQSMSEDKYRIIISLAGRGHCKDVSLKKEIEEYEERYIMSARL